MKIIDFFLLAEAGFVKHFHHVLYLIINVNTIFKYSFPVYYWTHFKCVYLFETDELIPILNERAGFPPDTELLLFEEIRPNMVERISNYSEPLEKVNSMFVLRLGSYEPSVNNVTTIIQSLLFLRFINSLKWLDLVCMVKFNVIMIHTL